MKLWYSFQKELVLSSKSWYFYIEIGMSIVLLLILMLVVPENFDNKSEQYIYLELPGVIEEGYREKLLEEDLDELVRKVEVKADSQFFDADLYETEESNIYLLDSLEALNAFSEVERLPAVHVWINEDHQIASTYFLQGYETQALKDLLLVSQNKLAGHDVIKSHRDDILVKRLHQSAKPLNDRENVIPVFLTFNGSLMSLFIIAAYIFLDKQEGIIKAYAITASSVAHYLLSKIGVIILTSILTSLIVTVPVMKFQPNYFAMLLFLFTSGFFIASLGLYLTSYYEDIVQAFGLLYIIIMIMIIPNISYYIPSWNPSWVKIIPSYVMLQCFKEIISIDGNMTYVMLSSIGFMLLGVDVFILADNRFKKTLSL